MKPFTSFINVSQSSNLSAGGLGFSCPSGDFVGVERLVRLGGFMETPRSPKVGFFSPVLLSFFFLDPLSFTSAFQSSQ